MEEVPDMDALLDEVENLTDPATERNFLDRTDSPAFQSFPPPPVFRSFSDVERLYNEDELINEPIAPLNIQNFEKIGSTSDFEEDSSFQRVSPSHSEKPKVQESPPVVEKKPEPSSEIVLSENITMERPVDEIMEKPTEVTLEKPVDVAVDENQSEPLEAPVASSSDFDAALERYLDQFPEDEEESNIKQKETMEPEEVSEILVQAAKTVADTILSNVIEVCESAIVANPIYTDFPTHRDDVEDNTEQETSNIDTSEFKENITEITETMDDMTLKEEKPSAEEPERSRHPSTSEPVIELAEVAEVEGITESFQAAWEDEMVTPSVVNVTDEPSGSHRHHENGFELAEETAENSIATVHNLDHEASSSRLTESELLLGKQKPYWIPDSDCDLCMLCSARFSLLSRRHHCRACGRVLCSACCSGKAILEYMKAEQESKKLAPVRVCGPCMTTLAKIEQYEKERVERASAEASSSSRVKGVLKSRSENEDTEASTSEGPAHKRNVTFRDGVNPGSSSGTAGESEKSTAVKPKKKSRKRPSIVRRVTELRIEDELSSYLPATSAQNFVVRQGDGVFSRISLDQLIDMLKDGASVTILKHLICNIQSCSVAGVPVWSIMSEGFAAIGLDEVLFVWKRKNEMEINATELLVVLERISQIFRSSLEGDSSGVQQVASRFPHIHSTSHTAYPLSKHIYFYRPTSQIFGEVKIPTAPFLVACFLADSELSWVMACPNRVLFRLGQKYGVYPHPFVNYPDREAIYTADTNSTVLKVFTDFRNWSFRMAKVTGSTLKLTNETTVLKIPRGAQAEIQSIISWNRSMLAWCCDVNLAADSHLVCEENDGLYSTSVFSNGFSRDSTGASFVILDGGLKTSSQLQVNVVEDGVAIRVQAEQFRSLCEALNSKEPQNLTIKDSSGAQFFIEWVDNDHNCGEYAIRSPIDGLYLEDKFQYGLSLERVMTAVLEVQSVPGFGIRLSHVYNLHKGRLSPEDEPKIFSIVEMLSRECTSLLGPYLPMLLSMDISSVSIRFYAFQDSVEYDVSSWVGLEQENSKYRESMDQLIPVLCNCAEYVSNGIHIEFTLTFVSTTSLPSGD